MTLKAALVDMMMSTFQKPGYCIVVHLLLLQCMFRRRSADPELLLILFVLYPDIKDGLFSHIERSST